MSERAAFTEVSDRLAAFAVARHSGTAFSAAAAAANALLERARAVRDEPLDGALAAYGPALRGAFVRGAVLARDGAAPHAAAVAAAALAAAEIAEAGDAQTASAVAVGCELAARLARGVESAGFRARWNAGAIAGRFGATAAAARLLGLDAIRSRHALGLAATQAAGLAANHGTGAAALDHGKAAFDALEAALLAQAGFTSAGAAIEGRRGFAAVMADAFDAPALVRELDAAF